MYAERNVCCLFVCNRLIRKLINRFNGYLTNRDLKSKKRKKSRKELKSSLGFITSH